METDRHTESQTDAAKRFTHATVVRVNNQNATTTFTSLTISSVFKCLKIREFLNTFNLDKINLVTKLPEMTQQDSQT